MLPPCPLPSNPVPLAGLCCPPGDQQAERTHFCANLCEKFRVAPTDQSDRNKASGSRVVDPSDSVARLYRPDLSFDPGDVSPNCSRRFLPVHQPLLQAIRSSCPPANYTFDPGSDRRLNLFLYLKQKSFLIPSKQVRPGRSTWK